MTLGLLDHLWQSSLFAGLVALLALLLRRQRAALRYRLWLLASLKFLIPFAPLAALGAAMSAAAPQAAATLLVLQPAAARVAAPAVAVPLPAHDIPVLVLAGLWALGSAMLIAQRLRAGLDLRRLSRAARDTGMVAAVPVKASASLLEPGLVGLWKPAVLLPAGLLLHLTADERAAILAHELGHWRRRDNLTAGLHMLVETLFWFVPPVWLIGARLIDERERACDEAVLEQGHDAGTYAGAILKACRFCIASPLACAPGATGALTRRIGHIVAGHGGARLDGPRAAMLVLGLSLAAVLPLLSGMTALPLKPLAVLHAHVVAVERKTEQAMVDAAKAVIAVPATRLTAKRVAPVRLPLDAALPSLPPQIEDVAVVVPTPLVASQFARADAVPAPKPRTVLNPSGDGPLDEVVCRARAMLPGSKLPGPLVCQPNRVWAALRTERLDFSEDGMALRSYAASTTDCPFRNISLPQLNIRTAHLPVCS